MGSIIVFVSADRAPEGWVMDVVGHGHLQLGSDTSSHGFGPTAWKKKKKKGG